MELYKEFETPLCAIKLKATVYDGYIDKVSIDDPEFYKTPDFDQADADFIHAWIIDNDTSIRAEFEDMIEEAEYWAKWAAQDERE